MNQFSTDQFENFFDQCKKFGEKTSNAAGEKGEKRIQVVRSMCKFGTINNDYINF